MISILFVIYWTLKRSKYNLNIDTFQYYFEEHYLFETNINWENNTDLFIESLLIKQPRSHCLVQDIIQYLGFP